MIVVVESNFVLELAFRQEQIAEAERIMELATDKAIEIAIPACALFEPFETLIRRRKERSATLAKFSNEIMQLGRSQHFPDLMRTSESVARVLAKSGETEATALDHSISRILDCAHVIPLSGDILKSSLRAREQFLLQPQDAVVFASVEWYLNQCGRVHSIFANKNSADFSVPKLEAHFEGLNCKLLSTFTNTVRVLEHRLSGQ